MMTLNIANVTFNEQGLIPAIVQDDVTGKVLMLAYMNREAIKKTIETKETWFFSRSREELWHKGATSGNRQLVKRMSIDCDNDTILIQVDPLGPACHTNADTCFFTTVLEEETAKRSVVHEVIAEIKDRRENPVEGSYTSYLFREGIDKVLKKVGEESSEVIIGAKNEDKEELTSELSDLIYHSLVLMELSDVSLSDVKTELLKRRSKNEVTEDE